MRLMYFNGKKVVPYTKKMKRERRQSRRWMLKAIRGNIRFHPEAKTFWLEKGLAHLGFNPKRIKL